MKFVSAYDKTAQSRPVYLPEMDPETGLTISKTTQDDVKACDINNIMARFIKDGVVTHLNRTQGRYGDATQVQYETAFELINKADATFATLPAEIRENYRNDPANFLGAIEGLSPDEVTALLTSEAEDLDAHHVANPREPLQPGSPGSCREQPQQQIRPIL